jgi:hypothetical protein
MKGTDNRPRRSHGTRGPRPVATGSRRAPLGAVFVQAVYEFFVPDGRQRVAQHLCAADLPTRLDDGKWVRGTVVALAKQTVRGVHDHVKMVRREERIVEPVQGVLRRRERLGRRDTRDWDDVLLTQHPRPDVTSRLGIVLILADVLEEKVGCNFPVKDTFVLDTKEHPPLGPNRDIIPEMARHFEQVRVGAEPRD